MAETDPRFTFDPLNPPMMKCGHASHAHFVGEDGKFYPSCFICAPPVSKNGENRTVDDSPPSLEGRESHCAYYKGGKDDQGRAACPKTRHGRGNYPSVAPSSRSLPFFKHRPDKDTDTHYCGCWGWD
jgi:hypothetical protein